MQMLQIVRATTRRKRRQHWVKRNVEDEQDRDTRMNSPFSNYSKFNQNFLLGDTDR